MATTANDKVTEAKADAAAEKAYAAAAGETGSNQVTEAPKPAPARIDAAVAEVKAAPAKAPASKPATKKARPAARKPRAAKPAAAKAPVRKTAKAAAPKTVSPVSKLKDKIMATKTTDFAAAVKTAAADAQTRAKAAYDKLQAYAGEATELAKGNVEAIVESGKILGQGVQDIARGEVEAAKGAFETATADVKAMVAVKSPAELFKLQGEIARRNFDAMVARASKNAEVSMKLANDAFAPISSRISVIAEKVSKAA
jgi:phasin family protein